MDATNLIVYLPCDADATEDLALNTWTATGDVAISTDITKSGTASVHLPSGAFLTANNVINLNADKWTFSADCYVVSSSGENGFFGLGEGRNKRGIIAGTDGLYIATSGGGSWQSKTTSSILAVKNQWTHIEIDKDGTSLKFFRNGALFWKTTINGLSDTGIFIIGGDSYGNGNDVYFDEILFYEGVALHSEDFTPPTAEDYDELKADIAAHGVTRVFAIDVERKVKNAARTWRYENIGTADTLITTGTTLTGLSKSQSKTGIAFYQTAREKCFDLPTTSEIWIKFDVYFDGSNRWRAYNGSAGITAWNSSNPSPNALAFFDSDINQLNYVADICKKNTLQTVLLHMFSGSTKGVIEAWVDGNFIYRYTGDVNHGQDFADIYLQSDGAGTFFSNVIISNAEIEQDEETDAVPLFFDVEYQSRSNRRNPDAYVSLNNSISVTLPDDILPGATEFTIEAEICTTTSDWHMMDYMEPMIIGRDISGFNNNSWGLTLSGGWLCFWAEPRGSDDFKLTSTAKVNDGQFHQVAARSNVDGSLDLFCDDELVAHKDNANVRIADEPIWVARNMRTGGSLEMDLRDVRFWDTARTAEELFAEVDGTEENLQGWYCATPTGLADYSSNERTATVTGTVKYFELETVFVDVDYESSNDALAWRYEDCAVYIGTGAPIRFHVPKAYELWIRFDVYFDGVARWYAYDDGFEGMTGLTALTDLAVEFLSAGATVKSIPNVCKTKQTQTFLLHMISSASDGLIEAWAGLEKIGEYFGDVNHGKPFVDFMLRSDDVGTSFTELIISNTTLTPDEKPANVTRATKTSQLNICNTKTGVIWLQPGGDYPFPYITYTIRDIIRQTVEETVDIGEPIYQEIKSIWIKFDVLSKISRWWAYNAGSLGKSGICALASGTVDFLSNDEQVQHVDSVFELKQWQSFVLHMESDETAGLIELWVNGAKVSEFVGNVNNGEEFTDLYLVGEGDDVQFRNFIASTAPLTEDDTPKSIRAENFGTLAFVVRFRGKIVVVPLKMSAVKIAPAFVVRWFGVDWYNPLVAPDDENASPILVLLDGKIYAMSTG